ncbi:LysR family transcriptional regulator [Bordetella avium]|uniref:LysR family transcriptional regulator n=2 Tax=Bordetella avium TaxID=521 RepID=UPI000E0A322A|nr:LysR family transcriptional regulator [Bordetella avium]AZY54362.1 LysR family transcriptional regulator [Bordetella avium]RIQ12606.1 LysR family transcriptional regulator [Bordetella avium]RIQ17775.1 LysR family transcriptional regulator [Bordetella avium]RIQ32433.1 LysR family transcriptional regulator [Bordetella avium]RIQ37340.1 LysR family transcriptional regulator [Bordetella avium]
MHRLPKHVTLKHLNAFVAVAQESSFTHAAKRLFQTQSSVTTLIRQLESALGAALFERTSRRVLLTPLGLDFLPRVLRLLADFDGAIDDAVRYGSLQRGRVSVAAAPSAISEIIAPAAAGYAANYPGIRLYLRDDNSGSIQRLVSAGDVDFGLTSPWTDAPRLDFAPLLEDRFGVLYRSDDPGIKPGKDGHVRWRMLAGHKLVGVADETGIMALLRARADLPIEAASPFYEASSTTTQAALVQAGLGVALLPALAAHRVMLPGLSYALLSHPNVTRALCIVRDRDRALSPAAAALIEALRNHVRQASLPPGCRRTRQTDGAGLTAGPSLSGFTARCG